MSGARLTARRSRAVDCVLLTPPERAVLLTPPERAVLVTPPERAVPELIARGLSDEAGVAGG